MEISLQKLDEVNGKLTVKVNKSDYEEKVQKGLKNLKKKAQMPGFRPGMVPMSLVQKMYGAQVKADEVEKTISEGINNYIKEQKLQLLTEPMLAEGEEKIDIEKDDDFEMNFDLGFTPEFEIDLSKKDKIDFYKIEVGDKQVEEQMKSYRSRSGEMIEAENYEEGDLLRGSLVESDAKGKEKEGGITVEATNIMPKYFSNDDQKKLFENAKPNTDVVFNVFKAYNGSETEVSSLLKINKEEIAAHKGSFKFHVNSISHMKLAEVDQKLFDSILGKDVVKSEEEFRAQIKEDISKIYVEDSNYKFIIDAKDYCLKKVGALKFPIEIMKREMLQNAQGEEQKKGVEENFNKTLENREWALICTQLIEKLNVKINDATLKESAKSIARSQFVQYGMQNVPEEYIENYADSMLKDKKQYERLVGRAIDTELTKAIKNVVELNEKAISVEDFDKMLEK